MTNPLRRPQSPQRFFLNAPKQRNGECYVLNHDYMELDAYCVTLLRQIDTLSRPAVEPAADLAGLLLEVLIADDGNVDTATTLPYELTDRIRAAVKS